jgi:hypothetical protein
VAFWIKAGAKKFKGLLIWPLNRGVIAPFLFEVEGKAHRIMPRTESQKKGRFLNVLRNRLVCSALSSATENIPYAELGIRDIYSGELAMTPWFWMGRNHWGNSAKADGTVFTHFNLLKLGKAMALHTERIKHPLTHREIDDAARAWFAEHQWKGLRLRGDLDEYRAELRRSVEGAQRKQWFKASAEKWTRWTRHPDFPARPDERLLFAIRKHCEDAATPEFFLGASYRTGARLLNRLVRNGRLKLLTVPVKRLPFHSFDYRLIDLA